MIGGVFEATDGTGWQLNTMFNGVNLAESIDADEADQVQIWLPEIVDYEVWFNRLGTWRNFEDITEKFEDAHEDGCLPGTAFWYLSRSEEEFSTGTFSGQVNNSASLSKDDMLAGEYNMLASPFPIPLQLNVVDGVKLFEVTDASSSTDADEADQIQIWLPEIVDYEVWFNRLGTWRNFEDITEKFEDAHEDGLEVGKAFWYLSRGEEGTPVPTFYSPIAKPE